MKISPVYNNYISHSNKSLNQNKTQSNSQNKNQSFEGLWGETSFRTDFDPVLFSPKIETIYYYYPFEGEKQEDIDKIIEENSSAKIVDGSKYVVNECKQGYTLPFTEADYKKYMKATMNDDLTYKLRTINRHVCKLYLNHEFGTPQQSAINPAFKKLKNINY